MKLFRFVGMLLFTTFLSANFTSCSNNGDAFTGKDGSYSNEKKLKKVECGDLSYLFFYDNKGRLIESREVYEDDNYNIIFTWTENGIKESWNGEYWGTYIMENGLVRRFYTEDGDIDYYTYNQDGRLTIFNNITNFRWDGDKVTFRYTGDVYQTFTYDNLSCKKGYFPLIIPDSPLDMVHPEIFGMRTNKLPISKKEVIDDSGYDLGTTTFHYQFDKEGYIVRVTEKSSSSTYIYNLTWE